MLSGNYFRINIRSILFFSICIVTFSALALSQLAVVSVTPSLNALNVSQNIAPSVTFNAGINSTTLTNSTVRMYGSLSGFHSSTFSYNSSSYTATIIPNAQFKVGEHVTVTLTRGIRNISGDSLVNSYSWSFTVKTNASSWIFYQSSTIGVGNTPWGVAAADYDGNGTIDLAVTNFVSNTVSILKNDGSGSFTLSSTVTGLSGPVSIAAADFNGDGAIDLAVTNSSSNSVSILKNDGTGNFTISSTINVGINPHYVTAVDIDGDGAIDLAVANIGTTTVSILKNDGNGTFTPSSIIDVGTSPSEVYAADIDNDGLIDLIVNRVGAISILHNEGSGVLTLSSFTSSVGVNTNPVDMNGDGYVDLIVGDDGTNTLSVLENSGKGAFTKISTVGVGNTPFYSTAADFNGDGNIDICVGNNSSNNVSILKNNGSGVLSQTALVSVGINPGSIASADLDGNGTIDIIVTNGSSNNISILKNRPLNASIDISSSLLSFGSVSVGKSKSDYVKIYNDGTDSSLVVSNIVSSNAAFTVNRTSLTIAPLESDSILVTFLPKTKGVVFNDSLIFMSNDNENSAMKVSLSGSSTYSQPKVAFTLNFGGPVYAGLSILGDSIMYVIASNDAVYKISTAGFVSYSLGVSGDVRSY